MQRGAKGVLVCAAIAVASTVAFHLVWGDVDLNLADEGFLWYGVQRTLEGGVALRDFQSYDPGRYYWCAAWCGWLGDGILELRVALAAFGALGLFCGLLVVRRLAREAWLWPVAGATLLAWMFPRHKLFESSITMMAVWSAVRLLEAPTLRRHLAAGVFVGAVGVIGRNHVLYGTLGFLLLIVLTALWLVPGSAWRRIAAFAAGGVLGISPLLAMLAFVPGFGAAFLESVLFFSKEHGTNLPLPYPWPWRPGHAELAPWPRAAVGFFFVLPVLVYPLGLWLAARRPRAEALARRAPLIAASAIGVFYAHHASVRSDAAHLAQSLHPALLGALALPLAFGWRTPARATAWLVLAAASWLAASATNPVLAARDQVPFEAAGERLRLPRPGARYLTALEGALESVRAPGDAVFLAPGLTTLYPLLGERSPVWGIYFLWPASEQGQRAIVEGLEERGVGWALIVEAPVDGRAELRFSRTHPLVWRYLQERFGRVPTPGLPPNHFLLRRR